jgi:hypothetical protein
VGGLGYQVRGCILLRVDNLNHWMTRNGDNHFRLKHYAAFDAPAIDFRCLVDRTRNTE